MFSPPAPSLAPDLITANGTGSTSLVVEWTQFAEAQFQGKPVGYDIRYYPRLPGPQSEKFVRVNYQTNTTILTNLTVYTVYVICVSAVSSGGKGPESIAEAPTGAEGMRDLLFAIPLVTHRHRKAKIPYTKLLDFALLSNFKPSCPFRFGLVSANIMIPNYVILPNKVMKPRQIMQRYYTVEHDKNTEHKMVALNDSNFDFFHVFWVLLY